MCYPEAVDLPHPAHDPDSDAPAWDYVPGFESAEQYHAFAHYRDMGPQHRTVSGVARDLGISPGTCAQWARQGMWADRCASYDAYRIQEREALRRAAEARADQDWAEQRAELMRKTTQAAQIAVGQLLDRLRQNRADMRPNEITRLLDRLMHWQQVVNGEITEKVEVDHELDLSNATDEQLATLAKLLGKGTGE